MPNPNDGNMELLQKLNDKEPVSIKVFNVIGAVVHSSAQVFKEKSTSLNLSDLPSGAYYLIVIDSSGNAYKLNFLKK
jgi:hypothetical protein